MSILMGRAPWSELRRCRRYHTVYSHCAPKTAIAITEVGDGDGVASGIAGRAGWLFQFGAQ
jgi:hypothetical protein